MRIKGTVKNTPNGVLAKLWREIITQTGLSNNLGYLITRYVERFSPSDSATMKKKTRAAIEADITATELTWKKFLTLIFDVLQATKLELSIKIYFPNGQSTTHTIGVRSIDNKMDKKSKDNEGEE